MRLKRAIGLTLGLTLGSARPTSAKPKPDRNAATIQCMQNELKNLACMTTSGPNVWQPFALLTIQGNQKCAPENIITTAVGDESLSFCREYPAATCKAVQEYFQADISQHLGLLPNCSHKQPSPPPNDAPPKPNKPITARA